MAVAWPGVELEMETTCSSCPVQIEGTVNGYPFYFRERHGEWRFAIVGRGKDPVSADQMTTRYYRAGDGPVTLDHARAMIQLFAVDFAAGMV